MSRDRAARPRSNDTPEERHAKFLEKHEDRMRKVDESVESVKRRGAKPGKARRRRASA